MKRKGAESFADVIKNLLSSYQLDEKIKEVQLVEAWEKVVGKNINAYTKEKYIKRKTLYVHLSSAILRKELMMSKAVLIKSLNEAVNDTVINNIVFR